jgi:hypothetical protein
LKALGELLVNLASERPTPIGVDVFWPEDPLPVQPEEDHIERAMREPRMGWTA